MKKSTLLKTLLMAVCLLGGVSSAWADEETIYSWEGGSPSATQTGGTIKAYGSDGTTESASDINAACGSFYTIKLCGKADFSTNVVKITLNTALAKGDVIKVTACRNKDVEKKAGGFKAKFDKGEATVASSTGTEFVNINAAVSSYSEYSATPNTCSFNVPDAAEGSEVITMTRSHTGTNCWVTKIEIVREVATAPTINTQPVSANYKQNAVASALTVAATTSGGTLTYQWYSNSSATTSGATELTGQTTASYTPSTTTLGTTYYYCAVSDDNGTTNTSFASITVANTSIVGYTEAISGSTLLARSLTSEDSNITITGPSYGSAITDQGSKTVYIDNTTYTNNKSWRKSANAIYDNQDVSYTLTVASGYKMNVKKVNARIAVADNTYTWYVQILDGSGTELWTSSERTTTKESSGKIDNVDVSDKPAIQNLVGNVVVKLWVKQAGGTKYFSINYLQLEVETAEDDRSTYAMAVSANDGDMGTFTPADGTEIVEGEDVTFTATPNIGYKFVKWVVDGVDHAENPYTINDVDATHTAVAHFAACYAVTYDLSTYKGTTTKVLCNPNFGEVYANASNKYTIPAYANRYLYREGYILTGWSDGDNTYETGDELTLTGDITLTPVWTATTQTLANTTSEVTVTWNLRYSEILFDAWQGSGQVGYYTKPQTVNGELIAVPMIIDATSGKIDNHSRAANEDTQVNAGTKFTIPAVDGMTVVIANANTAFSTTTVNGSTEYTKSNENKTLTYNYSGSDETIDIIINEGNQYLRTIVVTYPKKVENVTVTSVGFATYVPSSDLDFTSTGIKAYTAKVNTSTGIVALTQINKVPANTPVLLYKAGGDTENIPVAASTDAVGDNDLHVGTGAAVETDGGDGKINYILNNVSGIGFYKAAGQTVATNRAYLQTTYDAAAARMVMVFADEETTGIKNLNADHRSASTLGSSKNLNNKVYDLQGRRVAQPMKGLYIVNGKKVVMK